MYKGNQGDLLGLYRGLNMERSKSRDQGGNWGQVAGV